MQQLGETPFGGIDAAAPLDGLKLFAASGFGNFGGFGFGAMVAPQIIFVERLQIFADGNYGGAGGIDSERLDLIAGDSCFLDSLARGDGQGAHLIVVRLRGVFRIFALAMEGIFGERSGEQTAFAIHDGNANAQSSEIDSSYDGHGFTGFP